MATDPEQLRRLARELAALTPAERAQVLSEVSKQFHPPPKGWKLPVLKGGKTWNPGPLRREDIYGDDGR